MYIMNADGSNLKSIATSQFCPGASFLGGGGNQLDWSLDSQNIVAVGNDGLYIMNIYDRKPIRILKTYDRKPISTGEKIQFWNLDTLTWSK
ncbi:hypothetical protein LR013_03150 [candidate division NPL-UPA2 bacterium]|nr:hypothetical protein [candidate division NPL-UPA2 bacterium]